MSGMAERLCQMLTWSRCGESLSDLLKGRIIAEEGNYTRDCHLLTNRRPLLPAPIHMQNNSQVKVSSPTTITTAKRLTMILQPLLHAVLVIKSKGTIVFCKTKGKFIGPRKEVLHIFLSLHGSL